MYIVTLRKGNKMQVKGYDYRIICFIVAMYYKARGYEVNYGDD